MRVILFRLRGLLRTQGIATSMMTMAVALAATMVLVLAAGAVRTLTASDRYVSSQHVAFDVDVEQSAGRPRTNEISALPAVDEVRTVTFVFGGLLAAGSEDPLQTLVFAGAQEAFGTRMVDGREPDPSVPGEFAATQSFVQSTGAKVGDRFRLITIRQSSADASGFDVPEPDGPTVEATLVGAFTGPTELQDAFTFALFPVALLDVGDVGIAASRHAVALSPGATIDDLRNQLDGLSGGPYGIEPADLVPGPVRDAVHARGQGIAIVALILTLTAVAVVGQLLGRQYQLSDLQTFTMRSLGMTTRQLVADPVARAAVPVVAGSVAAIGAAVSVSGMFPLGFVENIEPHPGLRFEPVVHVFGALAVGIGMLGWVTVAIALGQRRRRLRSPSRLSDGLVTRVRPVQAATGARFAFTRATGDRESPAAPLFGLVLVLAALTGAMTFGASLGRFIDEPGRYGVADASIGQGGSEIDPQALEALRSAPEIASVRLGATTLVSVGSKALDVTGLLPVVGDMTPRVTAGRMPIADDEIALGKLSARDLGVAVGDTFTAHAVAGDLTLRVAGLAVIPSVEGGDGIGLGGVVTPAGLRRIDPTRTFGTAGIELRPDAPPDALDRIASAIGTQIGPVDQLAPIRNLARVRSLPFVVAATLGLLGMLSLAHQLIVSARRRRHDVAILAALGADRRWVRSVVHWQATLSGLFIVLLALPLGFVAGRLVYRAFIDRVGVEDAAVLPVWMLLGVVFGTVLLANLVAGLPARRVSDQSLAQHLNAD